MITVINPTTHNQAVSYLSNNSRVIMATRYGSLMNTTWFISILGN